MNREDTVSFVLYNICLRSRPGDPNVVCQSVSQLVRGHVEIRSQDDMMTNDQVTE